jgi:hypothetical protein
MRKCRYQASGCPSPPSRDVRHSVVQRMLAEGPCSYHRNVNCPVIQNHGSEICDPNAGVGRDTLRLKRQPGASNLSVAQHDIRHVLRRLDKHRLTRPPCLEPSSSGCYSDRDTRNICRPAPRNERRSSPVSRDHSAISGGI